MSKQQDQNNQTAVYGKVLLLLQHFTHKDNYSLSSLLSKAWFKKQDEKMTRKNLQKALQKSAESSTVQIKEKDYLSFITHFGPDFTGIGFWNKNKICKHASELLIVTDEAFIHLYSFNYSAIWKAQEEKKRK